MKIPIVVVLISLFAGALLAPHAAADDSSIISPPESTIAQNSPPLWGNEDVPPGYGTIMSHTESPCEGQLHYIHKSSHRPGRMNVGLEATCSKAMDTLHIWAQLWEVRWWGWDRIGTKGKDTQHDVTELIVYANDKCRNNYIRATANGWGILNGNIYGEGSGFTRYANNPCGL